MPSFLTFPCCLPSTSPATRMRHAHIYTGPRRASGDMVASEDTRALSELMSSGLQMGV